MFFPLSGRTHWLVKKKEAIMFHHMSTSTSVSTSECLSAAYLWWDFSVKGALVKSLFTASLTQLYGNAESQSEQFNL